MTVTREEQRVLFTRVFEACEVTLRALGFTEDRKSELPEKISNDLQRALDNLGKALEGVGKVDTAPAPPPEPPVPDAPGTKQ